MCVYAKIIHVLYSFIQNEHSCVLKWNEIFNLSDCLYYLKHCFYNAWNSEEAGFMTPLHHFIADGCISDINKSWISLICDKKGKVQSFWISTFTQKIEIKL